MEVFVVSGRRRTFQLYTVAGVPLYAGLPLLIERCVANPEGPLAQVSPQTTLQQPSSLIPPAGVPGPVLPGHRGLRLHPGRHPGRAARVRGGPVRAALRGADTRPHAARHHGRHGARARAAAQPPPPGAHQRHDTAAQHCRPRSILRQGEVVLSISAFCAIHG